MNQVKPKQSLGQNFLIDENIARNIVEAINPQLDDIIVEIGPGQGALTDLLALCQSTLYCYEVDRRVVGFLQEEFESKSVHILHQDFLEADLLELSKKHSHNVRIVGNIPYHLTSEILFKAIDNREVVQDVTMMIQKEVAQRLIAKQSTKAYGILSVLCQFYGMPKILFSVSPNCFYPKPAVTSVVISWKMQSQLPYSVNEALFKTVVRTTFGKRRKMLRNSLLFLPYEPEQLELMLKRLTVNLTARPEELSVKQFVELTNEIEQALQE